MPDGEYGYLATRLVENVLERSKQKRWHRIVSDKDFGRARLLHAGAIVASLAAAIAFVISVPATPSGSASGRDKVAAVVTDHKVLVLPGDASVERGHSLLVTAQFDSSKLPGSADLILERNGEEVSIQSMTQSLDDPVFATRIDSIEEDLDYRIVWGSRSSERYQLSVFVLPDLVSTDLAIVYPGYAQLEDRLIENSRRVTAPEGSSITIIGHLNKAVSYARLIVKDSEEEILLVADSSDPTIVRATIFLEESMHLRVDLIDEVGRRNPSRKELILRVTRNRRPDLHMTTSADKRVSPIEELVVSAELTDDFGLDRHGFGYRVGGDASIEVDLSDVENVSEAHASYTIALEELNARPAQLVSYYFWAEDRDKSGAERRTTSDLHFAEVRPFEEIFRQAEPEAGGDNQQSPAGEDGSGQGGAGGAADLTELQKEVLLATWNLARRTDESVGSFAEDLQVVLDSQTQAREQLDELRSNPMLEQSQDAGASIEEIAEFMESALAALTRAGEQQSTDPLQDAVGHEQAAYQALLDLREREFEVSRDQQQGPPGSSRGNAKGGPSQSALNELELTQEQNRYEKQRQAGAEQAGDAARETRQALNKLKDLARRQSDMLDRIRELQSELLAAETADEREELQRRLDRLQESQEEILRDTDELQQQMDSSESASQLAEERQQLELTRDNVRRASEALSEGRLSQALTEASRAERELNELEEDLREAAGEQFGDRMRELQREARRLESEQVRLAEQMREQSEGQRSLREDSQAEGLDESLEQQSERLTDLLDEVDETMRDAESTEPLLAQGLFETLDDARRERIPDSLERSRDMLDRGFPLQAQAMEEEARDSITQLREGIEGAARSVLGSDAEALARAEQELDRLTAELQGELGRARAGDEPQDSTSFELEDLLSSADRQGAARERDDQTEPPGRQAGGQPSEEGSAGEESPPSNSDSPGRSGALGEQNGEGQRAAREAQSPAGQGSQSSLGGSRQRQAAPSLGGQPGQDPGATEQAGGQGGNAWNRAAPLAGEDFVDWSDRLREVQEMIDDPELSAEAGRIRDRARAIREDAKRESAEPNWDLVDDKILTPLAELQRRVSDELRRRRSEDALVPIDRDPVPPEFEDEVRRYYERLGRSK
ncbi:MAG: hypothetical protein ACI841_003032 [Planctomycetota bacterium]